MKWWLPVVDDEGDKLETEEIWWGHGLAWSDNDLLFASVQMPSWKWNEDDESETADHLLGDLIVNDMM